MLCLYTPSIINVSFLIFILFLLWWRKTTLVVSLSPLIASYLPIWLFKTGWNFMKSRILMRGLSFTGKHYVKERRVGMEGIKEMKVPEASDRPGTWNLTLQLTTFLILLWTVFNLLWPQFLPQILLWDLNYKVRISVLHSFWFGKTPMHPRQLGYHLHCPCLQNPNIKGIFLTEKRKRRFCKLGLNEAQQMLKPTGVKRDDISEESLENMVMLLYGAGALFRKVIKGTKLSIIIILFSIVLTLGTKVPWIS